MFFSPLGKLVSLMYFVRPTCFNFTLDPNDVEMQKNNVQEVRMAIRVDISWLWVFAGTGWEFVLSLTDWMLESEQGVAGSVVKLSLQ